MKYIAFVIEKLLQTKNTSQICSYEKFNRARYKLITLTMMKVLERYSQQIYLALYEMSKHQEKSYKSTIIWSISSERLTHTLQIM